MGLIPAMIKETGGFVAGMLFDRYELFCDIVEDAILMEEPGIFGKEGLGHIEPVEPYLLRIFLFVPEAAFASARLFAQLTSQCRGGLVIVLLPRDLIEHQQDATAEHVIEVIVFQLIGADIAFLIDEAIHLVLDVFEITRIPGVVPKALQPFPDYAFVIGPAGPGAVV